MSSRQHLDAVVFKQDAVAASAAQVAESAAKEEKPEPETPKVKNVAGKQG